MPARTVRIAEGAEASAGDLIICRRNDHGIEAGESGRTLANGDILRIEAITRRGIMVRRLLGHDPATGERRFTSQAFRYDGYQSADLAYAVTGHSAQGATVHTGIALVTGGENRQWLYPAMTRGTDANLAFVFTIPTRTADPQPGTRPAPELGRYERIRQERTGYLPCEPAPGSPGGADPREPIAVLADVLGRDGAELSASAIRQRNLANADHLGILHAIWTAETTAARHDRYRDLVLAALPPGHRQPLSHQARWLFRTLHAAELAGLDPAEVIGTAIASRDLGGARDIAAVLDARIRQRIAPAAPPAARPLDRTGTRPARTPTATPTSPRSPPSWTTAPSASVSTPPRPPPPGRSPPSARCPPTRPAAVNGSTKHRRSPPTARCTGTTIPATPSAPSPAAETPDKRAAWHQAFAALSPVGGADVRTMPDGRLWLIRDSLRRRDRLGAPPRRERTAAVPARRLRRWPGRHPRGRRSRRRPQGR